MATELPPPPPVIPPDVVPEKAVPSKPKRVPIDRPGLGRKGQTIPLLTNHFKVSVANVSDSFYHYSVVLKYEDGKPVDGKGIGRKVIDKLKETYGVSELGGKDLAYDGEKALFTVGPLPSVKNEFTVFLDEFGRSRGDGNVSPGGDGSPDQRRARRPFGSKTYTVELNFAAKVPMQAIAQALKGHDSENSFEAFRVLDIILRQNAAKQGCLLVRQSFFHDNPSNFTDLGGGVVGCRGFHSSFRTTQSGLSLNIDVSTTMIVKPGPVIDFLLQNQNARDPFQIDWNKAKRTLKNLRIKARPTNTEYKIVGLSELPCNQQTFEKRPKKGEPGEPEMITVSKYFKEHHNIDLQYSDTLPCLNVGRPKRPTYVPVELCTLVSLQRYTKALSTFQRSSLVEKSRQKPPERMNALSNALKSSNYNNDSLLRSCGVSIQNQFTQVEGRVLQAPKLKVGNGEDFFPRNGRWNFNNKKLYQTTSVEKWAIVNFSARCDTTRLANDIVKCGRMKGINVEHPFQVFDESPSMRRAPAHVRVEEMFEMVKSKLPGPPKFLLCILSERKNSDVYGPWKRRCLSEFGIFTQCIAPVKPPNDQYLTNVLLKINAKLGGINSVLCVEHSPSMPKISQVPTIILGMDVSHGSPGQSDKPSIAAVVNSRQWPLISKYRAAVRTQSPKVEIMDSLFKPTANNNDEGLVREALLDFYNSSQRMKPDQIIIFRDGVSESQFSHVLNKELDQIIEACKFLDSSWSPRFTLIVAQKNHHTKFFQHQNPENVPPGTVVDGNVCHPKNFDFYMCSHAGMIGTTRPTHYHVLYDENNFLADDLQELVHSLSYVYQRSTTAISVVAPICYAHLAAAQVSQFVKFDDMSETSSSHTGSMPVPELPRLHDSVSSSMFFC